MSYDLYFTQPEITRQQFEEYFSNREHYELEDVQAWYQNQDTGVYFLFEYVEESEEEDCDETQGDVSFNMNYYRPHFFGLEAEPEVQAFVEHFGCSIEDPQMDGTDGSVYSSDSFLRGWNKGNEFGYEGVLRFSKTPPELLTLSTDELDAIWKWNFTRKRLQQKLGPDVFVPAIMAIQIENRVQTTAVWPDAIPVVFPHVDVLTIIREKLAPRRLLRKKEDICLVGLKDLLATMSPQVDRNHPLPTYGIPGNSTEKEIQEYVKLLKPFENEIAGVSWDSVLNQEIVDKYRKE